MVGGPAQPAHASTSAAIEAARHNCAHGPGRRCCPRPFWDPEDDEDAVGDEDAKDVVSEDGDEGEADEEKETAREAAANRAAARSGGAASTKATYE